MPSYNFTGLEIIDNLVYISTNNELFSFNSKTVFNQQPKKQLQPYFTSILIDDKNQEVQNEYVLNDTMHVNAGLDKLVKINYKENGIKNTYRRGI